MRLGLVVAVLVCLSVVPASAEEQYEDDESREFLIKWLEETCDVTSVRGEMRIRQYDSGPFGPTESHAKGEFAYVQPRLGYVRWVNEPRPNRRPRLTKTGDEYKVVPFSDCHLQWPNGMDLSLVDDDEQTVYRCHVTKWTSWPFEWLCTADWWMPFLPGQPNKESFRDYSYKCLKKTDDHIWIRATRQRPSNAKSTPLGHFECYTLYFDYKTTKLLAACGRVIDDVEIQYEFLNVVFDPSSWQPPNIGKYRVIDVE